MTPFGMSHLGDFEATLFNKNSRNRCYGEQYMRDFAINGGDAKETEKGGRSNDCGKALTGRRHFDDGVCGTAEGVPTTKAIYNIARKLKVEMPITTLVYNILYKNAEPMAELKKLFLRNKTQEFRYE
jgi:glycerol-3-phosphate dehydrogenase (NAD(P)+)